MDIKQIKFIVLKHLQFLIKYAIVLDPCYNDDTIEALNL